MRFLLTAQVVGRWSTHSLPHCTGSDEKGLTDIDRYRIFQNIENIWEISYNYITHGDMITK